jgi:hypothetical protein
MTEMEYEIHNGQEPSPPAGLRGRGETRKLPLAGSRPQLLSRPACSESLYPLSYRKQGVAFPRKCSETKRLEFRAIKKLLYKLSCLQYGGAACSVCLAARISTSRDKLTVPKRAKDIPAL